MKILIEREHWNASIPEFETAGAAGMDLVYPYTEEVTINPGERTLVGTGLKIHIEAGYEVQIRPRSGLAYKKGLTVLNAPGTIDSDFRGEMMVLLINHSLSPVIINTGERIAQMVVAKYEQPEFIEVSCLEGSDRGVGGFGSTGK